MGLDLMVGVLYYQFRRTLGFFSWTEKMDGWMHKLWMWNEYDGA